MKKILLGTTALVGATALFAGAALAEDPKITVGGFSNFEAAWTHSDTMGPEQNRIFRNDNELHFNIAGRTDAGLGYGAEIDLQADIDGSPAGFDGSTNQGINAHRTYAWLQGDTWGHFEMGSNDGAARTLKVDASNIARATGGIDGDWVDFADTNAGNTSGTFFGAHGGGSGLGNVFLGAGAGARQFITSPRLPVENGPADTFANDTWNNDTKVTYYTPRFAGFQLGVSYAPSLVSRGQLTNRYDAGTTTTAAANARDVVEAGLNFETQFDTGWWNGVGLAAAVTGEEGRADNGGVGTLALNDIRAWNGGLKLSWLGWSLAGSYGDWIDSLNLGGRGYYWTAGVAYETGPIGASVTYLNSHDKPTAEDNKFQNVSVGVDYKLAPGLTPFAEYTWYDIDPTGGLAGTAVENRGNLVIVGTQLSF